MRTIADIIGIIIAGFGVIGFLGGLMVAQVNAGGNILAWAGVAAIFIGWLMSHAAGKKRCPQCAESIKSEARKCRHCGTELAKV